MGTRMGLAAPAGQGLRQRYAEVTGEVRRIFEQGIARLERDGQTEAEDSLH